MADLPTFLLTLSVAYALPGPDMLLLVRTGAARGAPPALAVAAGLAMARGLHVVLAGAGTGALVAGAPHWLGMLRLAGAAYLVWLGLGILRERARPAPPGGRMEPRLSGAFRQGLFTNLLNPKALLFCSGLLPQFVDPAGGAVPAQFLLLGAVLVGLGAAFDGGCVLAGLLLRGRAGAGRAGAGWAARWILGGLLIACGLHLALSPPPG